MTIFGAIASRDRAVVWGDTQISDAYGEPTGHAAKLTVNPLAGVVGVGCGWMLLVAEAHRVVQSGTELDAIVPAVAEALRKATPRLVPRHRDGRRFSFGGNIYAVAGWSASADRFVVHEFSAAEFFEPLLTTCSAAPELPELDQRSPPELADVERIAAGQAAELRERGAEVGRLTVATLSAHGIALLAPRDLPAPPPAAEPDIPAPRSASPAP